MIRRPANIGIFHALCEAYIQAENIFNFHVKAYCNLGNPFLSNEIAEGEIVSERDQLIVDQVLLYHNKHQKDNEYPGIGIVSELFEQAFDEVYVVPCEVNLSVREILTLVKEYLR
jgi:hypothetical protein